jgi:aminoglycoside 2'-N-acetyltransferase I
MSQLQLRVVPSEITSDDLDEEIRALCNVAYREDLTELFRTFGPCTHVVGEIDGRVVSHAMWVTRWLQPGNARPLETAYIEAVATLPENQGQGYASGVMQHLIAGIPRHYELAALSPAETTLYARLGWCFWRGPLSIRMPSGLEEATPDERVMVFELPGRAKLNLDQSLSAEWREGEVW